VKGPVSIQRSALSLLGVVSGLAMFGPAWLKVRGASPLDLECKISNVTSSTVSISWKSINGGDSVRVYLLADPNEGRKMLLATLPGRASGYKVTGLAPAVTAFLRVEADTQNDTVSWNGSARTTGGPRAVLDSPVREVHGYAPDILMIVIASGKGSEWQSGKWNVTRGNGSGIAVRAVSRDSVPVGAPEYQVGWGRPYRDDILDVDHRIYLGLAENIGSNDILRVQGPLGINFILSFNDRYVETPVIHLNQVGYNPRATRRLAYISGWMGDGGALTLTKFPAESEILEQQSDANGTRLTAVRVVPIDVRSKFDEEAGGEVRQIDLAGIPPAEGRHLRLRLPGIGVSWPTAVSESEVVHAFYVITRGLFLNRWGGNLKAQVTEWSRPPDYHFVFTGEITDFMRLYPAGTPRTGKRQLTAGYHDAGDFEQRPMGTVVPQLLMRAYELHPQSFADGQLRIPESGNGIPDLLDEALWGVSAWEELQEADGGVRQGVQSHRHPWGFYLASDDPLPYWTFARDANTTARAAGLLAQAARLVSSYDRPRASDLKQRAVTAWHYADANGAANSHKLYGAGELYRLTGEATYKVAFERAWHDIGPYGPFSEFAPYQLTESDYKNAGRSMADFIQGYMNDTSAATDIKAVARQWLTKYAEEAVRTTENDHAYRNPRPDKYPMDWGQGTTMARFLDPVIARVQLGGLAPAERQRYFDALSLGADYLLGGNPNGFVYITGLGSRHVEEPLHLDSLAFIKLGKGPMPGIPVFGPTATAPKMPYTQPTMAAFYPAFGQRPLALRYADVRTVPNFNEFSVWETQAPDAELFAALLGRD